MHLVVVVGCFLLLHASGSVGTNQHLVCKQIEDVFEPAGDITRAGGRRRLQGPPGKTGSKGERGFPGSPGHPGLKGDEGSVDYERVNAEIEARINSEINNLRMDMEARLNSPANYNRKTTGHCAVEYLGTCYWVEKFTSRIFSSSLEKCSSVGGVGADINDATIYDILSKYIRSSVIEQGQRYLDLWLGMGYNQGENYPTFRNGTRANFVKWVSQGQPNRGSIYTRMILRVRADANAAGQGMHVQKSYDTGGIICQWQ